MLAGAAVARALRYSFAGRVVLITGGSRGLGLVLARRFASEGARVAICARDAEGLSRAAADLRRRGAEAMAVECDVRRGSEVEWLVRSVIDRWGRLDVLVNNAGIIRMGPYEEMTLDDYREMIDEYLFAAVRTVQAVVPRMRRQGSGRVVNISSIGGLIGVPHLLPYCAAKFAVTGFSRGLRAELGRYGIRVTTVCPGLMRTGSPVRAQFKGRHRAQQTWFTLAGSLPGASVSAERAASEIVEACRAGQARLVISIPAKAAALTEALAPGVLSAAFGAVDRVLPRPGGIGTRWAEGLDSKSALSPSVLTALTARAAERNLELPPGRRWEYV